MMEKDTVQDIGYMHESESEGDKMKYVKNKYIPTIGWKQNLNLNVFTIRALW